MIVQEKVDKDYLKAFNLGYEIAKDLSLKSPMFKDQNVDENNENAMQAGMLEFVKENQQNIEVSVQTKKKMSFKNRGEGLIP